VGGEQGGTLEGKERGGLGKKGRYETPRRSLSNERERGGSAKITGPDASKKGQGQR